MCAPIRPGLRLYQVRIKDGLLAVSSLFHRHDDDYTPKNVPGRYMVFLRARSKRGQSLVLFFALKGKTLQHLQAFLHSLGAFLDHLIIAESQDFRNLLHTSDREGVVNGCTNEQDQQCLYIAQAPPPPFSDHFGFE